MLTGWPERLGGEAPKAELGLRSRLSPHIPWPFFTSQPSAGANFKIMTPVTRCSAGLLGSGSGRKGIQPTPHPPPFQGRSEVTLAVAQTPQFLAWELQMKQGPCLDYL